MLINSKFQISQYNYVINHLMEKIKHYFLYFSYLFMKRNKKLKLKLERIKFNV